MSRSRIPRLVLRPQPPQQQHKVSPASESPFSEEESREFNPPSSSGGSARTISSNSFCSGTCRAPALRQRSPRFPLQSDLLFSYVSVSDTRCFHFEFLGLSSPLLRSWQFDCCGIVA